MAFDKRRETQAKAVASHVMQGARVESESDYQAVMVRGKKVNHLLHFFIGLFTCGFWWIVWLFIALLGGESRYVIQTDESGNIQIETIETQKKLLVSVIRSRKGRLGCVIGLFAVLILVIGIAIIALPSGSAITASTDCPFSTDPNVSGLTELSGRGQDVHFVHFVAGYYGLEAEVSGNSSCLLGYCSDDDFTVNVGGESAVNEKTSKWKWRRCIKVGDGDFDVKPGEVPIEVMASPRASWVLRFTR